MPLIPDVTLRLIEHNWLDVLFSSPDGSQMF